MFGTLNIALNVHSKKNYLFARTESKKPKGGDAANIIFPDPDARWQKLL